MQGEGTERDASNCNNLQNKLDEVQDLAYNNYVANITRYVEVTNNILSVNNVRVA